MEQMQMYLDLKLPRNSGSLFALALYVPGQPNVLI